jgi:argininosuccinate synthase
MHKAHNVPIVQTHKSIYSRDRNLWHISHEGGPLEDPWLEPEEEMFMLSNSYENAPDQAEYVEIKFDSGTPTAVNGQTMSPAGIVEC